MNDSFHDEHMAIHARDKKRFITHRYVVLVSGHSVSLNVGIYYIFFTENVRRKKCIRVLVPISMKYERKPVGSRTHLDELEQLIQVKS